MPGLIPFAWSRSRGTTLASRAAQQDGKRRLSAWDPTNDVRVFTVPCFWMTKQRRRDFTLRVYYARGLYGGRPIPSLSVRAEALGVEDVEGAEIVADDLILARTGVTAYAGIGTAALQIADEMETDDYVDVDFRLAIPSSATTVDRFSFALEFSIGDATAWIGDGSAPEGGVFFEGVDHGAAMLLSRYRILVNGWLFTAAQRTTNEAAGLTYPADTVF